MSLEDVPAEPTRAHHMWTGIGEAIHAKIGPKIAQARTEATASMLERIEADLVPLVQPIAQRLLDDETTPAEIRPVLEVLAGPEHFSGSIVIAFAVGGILSPVLQAALGPALQALTNTTWHGAATTPGNPGTIRPSPDLLASSVLKGVLTETAAASIAADSGTAANDFATLVATAGQSLGFAEALLLDRRGQLEGETLDSVLQYSNVNPRFYAAAKHLTYSSPGTGAVLTGALKHHLEDGPARALYAEAGGNPVNYGWELASTGRPLGLEEMLHLLNRKVMTEADVRAGIAQSDINDTYTDFALELQHYFPPPRSVVPMLRSKAITETQARTLLGYYGVDQEWSDAFVKEAQTTTTGAVKELTAPQVTAQYEARLMDAPTALGRIEAVGYSAADAQALLDLADEKRTAAMQNATLRKIGAQYVGRKITLAEATIAMSAAAIPTAAQHDAVHFWDVEKSVNVHVPSPAQVVGAYRRDEITALDCKIRLQRLGIADDDLAIFVADGWPPTKQAAAGAAAAAVVNA